MSDERAPNLERAPPSRGSKRRQLVLMPHGTGGTVKGYRIAVQLPVAPRTLVISSNGDAKKITAIAMSRKVTRLLVCAVRLVAAGFLAYQG